MQTPAIDPDSLRLYYLQQLGISIYVSRAAAAAAPAEAAVELPHADQSPPPVMPEPAAAESLPAAASRTLLKQWETDDSPSPAPAAAAERRPVPAAANHDDTVAPFQLLFGFAADGVGVAVQIPALAKGRLTETEARLLANVLRWLGLALPSGWLQFQWPLPGRPAGGIAQAGKSLHVFLQQASEPGGCRHLVLLGQAPQYCLTGAGLQAALPGRCWATHGLAEMLAVPALKREVWQALLPLQAALAHP